MEQNNNIKLFEDKNIRIAWNDDEENWYFSVVDIVAVLTDNDYQKSINYWKWLKNKLIQEGSQLVSDTNQLKIKSTDGKYYNTDVMNTEQILRLVQSIPSKKAEPFKLWLAETSVAEISKSTNAQGIKGAEQSVIKGGNIAKLAKEQLEKETGKNVISNKGTKEIGKLDK